MAGDACVCVGEGVMQTGASSKWWFGLRTSHRYAQGGKPFQLLVTSVFGA